MIKCPHCVAMTPVWNRFKKMVAGGVTTEEKESATVTQEDNVGSFPTVVLFIDGVESKRIEGSRSTAEDICKELGVSSKSSKKGGRTRSRRALRRRTLRNRKSFV